MILIGRPWLAIGRQLRQSTSGSRRRPRSRTPACPGRANCAPIADGSPKPIEPSPPELIHRRGSLNRMNCAAHIWCWPTSAVDDRLAAGEPVDLRHQVLRLDLACPTSTGTSGCSSFQARDLAPPRAPRRREFARLHLPASVSGSGLVQLRQHALHVADDRACPAARFLPISAGSMSTWMTRACGAKAASRPGDAVVEAHAQRDQQVRVRTSPCSPRSCRACPAC